MTHHIPSRIVSWNVSGVSCVPACISILVGAADATTGACRMRAASARSTEPAVQRVDHDDEDDDE